MAACGSAHTAGIDDEGRLYTWGANASGALGIGNKASSKASKASSKASPPGSGNSLLKYSLARKY
jgi:alpha-tubulin suppressor-like RCC1 family protein